MHAVDNSTFAHQNQDPTSKNPSFQTLKSPTDTQDRKRREREAKKRQGEEISLTAHMILTEVAYSGGKKLLEKKYHPRPLKKRKQKKK